MRGRVVPELQKEGITLYREIIVAPWRILYKVDAEVIYLMAIVDSRRNIEDVLLKKIINGIRVN